jgi:hypothetical protein
LIFLRHSYSVHTSSVAAAEAVQHQLATVTLDARALLGKRSDAWHKELGATLRAAEARQPALWVLEHADALLASPETEGVDPLPTATAAAHVLQLLATSRAAGHVVIPVFVWCGRDHSWVVFKGLTLLRPAPGSSRCTNLCGKVWLPSVSCAFRRPMPNSGQPC